MKFIAKNCGNKMKKKKLSVGLSYSRASLKIDQVKLAFKMFDIIFCVTKNFIKRKQCILMLSKQNMEIGWIWHFFNKIAKIFLLKFLI